MNESLPEISGGLLLCGYQTVMPYLIVKKGPGYGK